MDLRTELLFYTSCFLCLAVFYFTTKVNLTTMTEEENEWIKREKKKKKRNDVK